MRRHLQAHRGGHLRQLGARQLGRGTEILGTQVEHPGVALREAVDPLCRFLGVAVQQRVGHFIGQRCHPALLLRAALRDLAGRLTLGAAHAALQVLRQTPMAGHTEAEILVAQAEHAQRSHLLVDRRGAAGRSHQLADLSRLFRVVVVPPPPSEQTEVPE